MLQESTIESEDGLRSIRRDIALVDPEFAMLLPTRMRVQRLAIPAGEPGSWTWDALTWERDPWAQEFVLTHPSGATLEDVGALLGLTRERVRQVEEAALRKLARAARLSDGRLRGLCAALREERDVRPFYPRVRALR